MESHARKVLLFRDHTGISPALTQSLLKQCRKYGFNNLVPFSTSKIVLADWVHLKCRYGCSRYNSSWCCPPATPGLEKVRAILSEYTTALLVVGSKSCSDFYRENGRKRLVQVRGWKGMVSLERKLFLEGYYKAFSLVGECCALCKECAYPDNCRFPQDKRPSLESFSIDVISTLKNLGATPQIATKTTDTFNYYAIILLE